MESVFIVWQAEYGERYLKGVFSTREKAVLYLEEFEANDEDGLYHYYVTEEKVIG